MKPMKIGRRVVTNLSLRDGIKSVKGAVVEVHQGGMISIVTDEQYETTLGQTNRFNVRVADCELLPMPKVKR